MFIWFYLYIIGPLVESRGVDLLIEFLQKMGGEQWGNKSEKQFKDEEVLRILRLMRLQEAGLLRGAMNTLLSEILISPSLSL